MTIEMGKTAPAFTLKDQHGNKIALKDFRGSRVVVYFYPKDDTPGCTKQACGFRDLHTQTTNLNTVVLGISPDDGESHQKFIQKFNLPFILLSDPDKKVMEKYAAWGEKMMYGRKSIGTIRSTVLIDENGKVIKHWKKVPKAQTHPQKVLEVIQQL